MTCQDTKERNQARGTGTHKLETTGGWTCQDTERKSMSERYSLAVDHRGRDLSGHRKKATEQEALTNWRP